MKNDTRSPFDPAEGFEETAVWNAIHRCGSGGLQGVYDWLEETPRTSLVVEMVDALHELGYKIVVAHQ